MSDLTTVVAKLEEIRKDAAPSPRESAARQMEIDVIKKAGELPMTALLAIPAVFATLLPLLFDHGKDLRPESLAALLTTFFLVFFCVPLMLLVFRAYEISYGLLFLYALAFAWTAYGIEAMSVRGGVRAVAIVLFAVAFGTGPQMLVSRWPQNAWRHARAWWTRRSSKPAAGGAPDAAGSPEGGEASTPADANAAGDPPPDPAKPSSGPDDPAGAKRTSFRLPNAWSEQRSKLRRPAVPIGALSVILPIGIVLLFMAPRSQGDLGWRPAVWLGALDDSAHVRPAQFIRWVDEAKQREDHAAKLRGRDEDALALLPRVHPFWSSAVAEREAIVAESRGVFAQMRDSILIRPDSTFDGWIQNAAWKPGLDRLHAHRGDAIAASRGARGDAEAEGVRLLVARERDAVRAGLAARLSDSTRQGMLADTLRIQRLQDLEGISAILASDRAERHARLLAADDALVSGQREIFLVLNRLTQERMALIINNSRVVGLWIFISALLVLAGTLGASNGSLKEFRGAPGSTWRRFSNRLLWFGMREARRRGTYVLGCAILALFTVPLLKKIEPEKLDLSKPFSPFTLPNWYLPAFAGESVGMRMRDASASGYSRSGQRLSGADATPEVITVTDTLTFARVDTVRKTDTVPDVDTIVQPPDLTLLNAMMRTALDESFAESSPVLQRVRQQVDLSNNRVVKSVDSSTSAVVERVDSSTNAVRRDVRDISPHVVQPIQTGRTP